MRSTRLIPLAALAVVLAGVQPGQAETGADLDTTSREAVENAFLDAIAASTGVRGDWTGSYEHCDPGTVSPAMLAGQLAAVNFERALVGVPAATLDPKLTEGAQKGAFAWASGDECGLNQADFPGWKIHCDDDPAWSLLDGSGLRLVPYRVRVGIGWLPGAGDLDYQLESEESAGPDWLAWPSAGWFPEKLHWSSHWELAAPEADFTAATVTLTDAKTGAPIGTRIKDATAGEGLRPGHLVWEATDWPEDREPSIAVTVSGVTRGGQTVSHSYTVNLFVPSARIVGHPNYTGEVRVGETLTAQAARTVPKVGTTFYNLGYETRPSFSWWRDGVRVKRYGQYRVRLADQGHRLVLRQRVSASGFTSPSAFSEPTPVVLPATRLRSMGIRIEGTRKVGQTVRAVPEWTFPRSRVNERFQWYRWGDPIPGATKARLILRKRYASGIRVRIQGRSGGQHATQWRQFRVQLA